MGGRLGADGETAALITALTTVGADRLVKLYMERFVQRVDDELRSMAEQQKAVICNEVRTEISGFAVIEDHAAGCAPSEYVSLRKPPVG